VSLGIDSPRTLAAQCHAASRTGTHQPVMPSGGAVLQILIRSECHSQRRTSSGLELSHLRASRETPFPSQICSRQRSRSDQKRCL
jgi:hypothetical protein